MSKSQKIVLCVAGFLVLGMLLYPPFHYVRPDGAEINMGYGWIFNPPKRPESKALGSINSTTLLLQWTGILIAGGIAFFVIGSGKKDQQQPSTSLSSVGPEMPPENPPREKLPSQVLRCPHCSYTQNVPLEKIPKDAIEATCPSCRTKFDFIKKTASGDNPKVADTKSKKEADSQFIPAKDGVPIRAKSIGGWLFLLGAGIYWNVIRHIGGCLALYASYKDYKIYAGTPVMNYIWIEVVGFIISTALAVYVAGLFSVRDRRFTKTFVVYMILELIWLLVMSYVSAEIVANKDGYKTIANFLVQVLVSIIWIPYVLMSKRVKYTFVN